MHSGIRDRRGRPVRTDARSVDRVLEHPAVERREVLREQHVVEVPERHLHLLAQAEDLCPVLRLSRSVLLPVGRPDPRMHRHDDASLRSIDAGLPRTGGRDDLPVLVLLRVLAEVPDVAAHVLRVPVERVLDQLAALGHLVVHHGGLDTEDLLRPRGDGDLVLLLAPPGIGLAVEPSRARRHRPERVVDALDEGRRIERDRIVTSWEHDRTGRGRRSATGDRHGQPEGHQPRDRPLHLDLLVRSGSAASDEPRLRWER
jgi:hypothetical protein